MLEEKVKFTEALITDKMLTEVRKFIGTSFRIGHSINNKEATEIAIQKFADGIGDTNPLWTDPEYAAKTRYGTIVAPPGGLSRRVRIFTSIGSAPVGYLWESAMRLILRRRLAASRRR